jgi:hypothetical protein
MSSKDTPDTSRGLNIPIGGAAPLGARLSVAPAALGFGVEIAFGKVVVSQPFPICVILASGSLEGTSIGYESARLQDGAIVCVGALTVSDDTEVEVTDCWRAGEGTVRVSREVRVRGGCDDGFMTSLTLARDVEAGWSDVIPFAPGVLYGDAEPVPTLSIGSRHLRRLRLNHLLCREDRLAAPLFAVAYPDRSFLAVLHERPDASTTVADGGSEFGGESLTDARFGFASLGGVVSDERLEIGAWFPGSEGPVTYSSGPIPLTQKPQWRRRFHPLTEGVNQHYELAFRLGECADAADLFATTWRWAWEALAPSVEAVDPAIVVSSSAAVLASRVCLNGDVVGFPLEVDAVSGRIGDNNSAIMGFVGANTDAAYLLLRVGDDEGGAAGAHYREIGEAVLDSFTALPLDPPLGEGFDLATGEATTYRDIDGIPAVYTRSIADGCAGALKAFEYEATLGRRRYNWLAWARHGGDWFVTNQRPDGSLPRAWEAGTGSILDASTTASHLPVAFLSALNRATGDTTYLKAALGAAEFAWRALEENGCFAGATIDNPDVVDKEGAVFALEGALALYLETRGEIWLERAISAARLTETWIYAWNVPMPVDADEADLHWKTGVPTVGQQLIATGVSACDGFLAMNAAAFALLSHLTGDEHFLDVARIVAHGTKAMLALPGRTFDLRGAGWQQEHWCFAVPRGLGFNRNWLPWVAVANVEGILRLRDLGEVGAGVLWPPPR